jgi:Protein of unknown function (DUF2505)
MAESLLRSDITCSADVYFDKCLFDEAYNQKLYAEVLKFPGFKMLECKRDGAVWTRKCLIDPPLVGLPGPVAKLIGDRFSYTEEGKFDTKTKRYTFSVTPSSASEKTKTNGESWCEDKAGGATLITKLNVEVKIFMVGGMVEEKILKDFGASMQQAVPFINAHTKA